MDHILIKYAKRKPFADLPKMPKGAIYDKEKGYWVINDSPLTATADFQKQQTKKCDLETGEDQKGD